MISSEKTIAGKSSHHGFTIIEVMIVLAIAGLILTVILLAVPSLLRSHRTFQRRHDAFYVVQERIEFEVAKSPPLRNYPEMITCNTGQTNPDLGPFCDYIQTGLSFYTPDEVTIIANGYHVPAVIPVVGLHQIITESYLTCNSDGTAATTTGATPFSVAVIFAVESAAGPVTQCLRSSLYIQGS